MGFGFTPATGTDAELLELVREAIATVCATGQSYVIRNREYTAADLDKLFKWETFLANRIERANSGMSRNFVRIHRRVPNQLNGTREDC